MQNKSHTEASRVAREGGRNNAATCRQRLEMGGRIAAFFADNPGLGARPWRIVSEQCFHLVYTDGRRKQMQRAYEEWKMRSNDGRR